MKSVRRELSTSRRIDMSISPFILDVAENDEISLKIYSQNAITSSCENDVTWMTVQEI